MKLDISKVITDYDNNPVNDGDGALTVRRLLRMYAGSFMPTDQTSKAAEQSVIASAVGLKIHNANGEVELTDEEMEILKLSISTPRHAALVYSQIREAVFSEDG